MDNTSSYNLCPSFGVIGIRVSRNLLVDFAHATGVQSIYTFIPIPNTNMEDCIKYATGEKACAQCEGDLKVYDCFDFWETDTGRCGYCCDTCGYVFA